MASKPHLELPPGHRGDAEACLPVLLSSKHSQRSPMGSPTCASCAAVERRLRAELQALVEAAVREQLSEVEARLLHAVEEHRDGDQPPLPYTRHSALQRSTASSGSSLQQTSCDGDLPRGSLEPSLAKRSKSSTVSSDRLTSSTGRSSQLGRIEEATPSQFVFSHSTWDVSMLVGIDAVGLWESIFLVILMCLTMVVVLVFCGIVLTNFTEPGYDDTAISQLRGWRLNTAHFFAEVDKITGVSLASRACNLDKGLATSAEQVATISTIRNYLTQQNSWITSGPAMCMTALVLWYLTIIKEFAHIMRGLRGFMFLPTDRGTRVVVSGDSIALLSVSRPRKAWVVLSVVMRLLVLYVLAYAGTLYIVYTVEVRDLLLNCVALEVVLSIDELAFSALASSKLQGKVDKMTPLLLRSPQRRPSVIGRMWGGVALCAVGLALVLAGTQVLAPYAERLQMVEHVLCGGERDFAVFVMDAVGVPIMSFTPPFNETERSSVFSQRAIDDAINSDGQHTAPLARKFAMVAEQSSWHEFQSFLANADGYPGPDMDDLEDIAILTDDGDKQAYVSRLRDLLGDDSGSLSCQDLQGHPLCYGYNSVSSAVRFLCPVSCGCGTLQGGLKMNTNAYCPDGAIGLIEAWLEELSCADNASAMRRIYALEREYGAELADMSCERIAAEQHWCEQTSVAAYCPSSCGCASDEHPFCPPSCGR